MTKDELIAAMARAMRPRAWIEPLSQALREERRLSLKDARAALSIARPAVLEEAAKVAETLNYDVKDFGPEVPGKMLSGVCVFDNRSNPRQWERIAAAIRALAKEQERTD